MTRCDTGGTCRIADVMDVKSAPRAMVRDKTIFGPLLRRLATLPETIVVIATVLAVGGAAVWNLDVGLRFKSPIDHTLLLPALFLVIALVYVTARPGPKIAEAAFYIAMWQLFSLGTERLSYLGIALHYNLQDAKFAVADRALGLDWLAWRQFVVARPWLVTLHNVVYPSFIVQPLVLCFAAAFLLPRRRNAEIFMALVVASIITLVVNARFPAVGPGEALGIASEQGPVIEMLRASPTAQTLPYAGLVSMPSFHAIMALLMVYGMRGMRFLFPATVVLNSLMLAAVPLGGNHYFVDVLGGVATCGVAILVARALVPSRLRASAPAGAP
jgi:hypothetical protein